MITLYTFGPYFGLPDASPFVIKAMLLLKFAGLDYREDRGGFRKAPKGKLPYINDDGTVVPDSTFIRFHVEKKYGFDGGGLGGRENVRGASLLGLGGVALDRRHQFCQGTGPILQNRADAAPAGRAARLIRRKVAKMLKLQGLGRHTGGEQADLAIADINALGALIGDKAFLMGKKSCGADATAFAFVASFLTPVFDTPIRTAAERHPNLAAYKDRIARLYFSHSEAEPLAATSAA
jgi:glutathione S-transferase